METSAHAMQFLSGNEALARGAYEDGLRVACAYPGTPSTEILETLACYADVDTQWSVNEKVAFEVALAASIAGARSLFAAKHVGVNVAMDPLMTAAYTGVNAGFVVVTADDPGLHSSQNEQDNRHIARFAKLPLLEPASPAEAKAFAQAGFALSEAFDTPVLLRVTTRVAHTKENVAVAARGVVPLKPFQKNPSKYVMVPGYAYQRHRELEARLERLRAAAEISPLNRIEMGDPSLGIIAGSVSYLYAREAYPTASFLKLGFSYPFPDNLLRAFAARVKEVVVVEELEPFLEEHLLSLGIRVRGKHPSFRVGELRPELMPAVVEGRPKEEMPSTTRKPVMCPGCPHRPVFRALKKLKATVAGDIGCYTLGALPPIATMHSCVCMGTGVTFFEGFGKVLGGDVVGIIGDSTFVHSGITGLVNAAYNGAKGVIIILDNGTTAMTGSQENPATGTTITGAATKKLSLENLCAACGADTVDVVDPHDFSALEQLLAARMADQKLSVIITRAPCRIIQRAPAAMPAYDETACKKCGLCLQIDCPAITKTASGHVSINPVYCVGCRLCADVCTFGALKKIAAEPKKL
jgi:indolepyruvate ferredoxin oxidoreductase alpha subunit